MLDPAQNGKPALPKPLAGLSQNRSGPLSSFVTYLPSVLVLIATQILDFNANH
jgi:hypothetical protein